MAVYMFQFDSQRYCFGYVQSNLPMASWYLTACIMSTSFVIKLWKSNYVSFFKEYIYLCHDEYINSLSSYKCKLVPGHDLETHRDEDISIVQFLLVLHHFQHHNHSPPHSRVELTTLLLMETHTTHNKYNKNSQLNKILAQCKLEMHI